MEFQTFEGNRQGWGLEIVSAYRMPIFGTIHDFKGIFPLIKKN